MFLKKSFLEIKKATGRNYPIAKAIKNIHFFGENKLSIPNLEVFF